MFMIPRYSRPQMVAVWQPENKFRIWFEIEAHACDAQAELGVIPKEAARALWERGGFDVARIDESRPRPSTMSSPSSPILRSMSARRPASSTRE